LDNKAAAEAGFTGAQSMLFNGVRNGVLYRQLILRKPPNNGVGYIIDLAEITIPGGVVRVDRCRLAFEHELTLGHYGLPHIDGKSAALRAFENGPARGIAAAIAGRQLALIAYSGWDEIESRVHRGFNAEAEESTVLYVHRKRTAQNPAMELMITAMLHKTGDTAWTAEELNPVKNLSIVDVTASGSVLGAELTLSDGAVYVVDFKDVDGYKSC
jgi:hypothetical protein